MLKNRFGQWTRRTTASTSVKNRTVNIYVTPKKQDTNKLIDQLAFLHFLLPLFDEFMDMAKSSNLANNNYTASLYHSNLRLSHIGQNTMSFTFSLVIKASLSIPQIVWRVKKNRLVLPDA